MKNIGAILVVLGAISYATVGVILALAKQNGFSIQQIIVPMYFFAFLTLFILFVFSEKNNLLSKFESLSFLLAGFLTVSTTYCFYQALTYVGVPLATLFLMQSSWMTPLLSHFLRKNIPCKNSLITMLVVTIGIFISCYTPDLSFSFYGLIWGVGAAFSYSLMLTFSANVAKNKNIFEKSAMTSLGALLVSVVLFSDHATINIMSPNAFWALIYACFSTVLPLIFLTIGTQKTPSHWVGLLIVSEIPAAYILSYLFLSEKIYFNQIFGCIFIMFAIIYPKKKPLL
ncbi:DMT family transporter [Acinetobacter rathckeae]|uniref:DMT family transporter n=1 Tax=Acinetobacter rathckeae TaxID=2605272 RepID=UPI0018A326EC|nr:DMT family transporter [Acinetobacter rathckeae]MBF7688201.1 DMT family transporter [Acinetobacter rathckeae]MBF7695280.1 DMT family transporter [Acinetobacter rathckeae]